MDSFEPGLVRHLSRRNMITALRRPSFAFRRAAKYLHEFRHPGDPWIAPEAVRLLDHYLGADSVVLEWGSGRSTLWFARRVRHVHSVEHDARWAEAVRVRRDAAGLQGRAEIVLVNDGQTNSDAYVAGARDAPSPVDVVLVDGLWREQCVSRAVQLVRPGGLLVVDNSDRVPPSGWPVPAGWPRLVVGDFFGEQTTVWLASPAH